MSTYLTTGFVLKSLPWREHDRLYHVLTADYGKMELIVAGSRKLASKLSGHLPVLAKVELMIARGRRLDRVASANLVESYFVRMPSPQHLALALCFLEIVDRLTVPYQHERECYNLLQEYLPLISKLPLTLAEFRIKARALLSDFISQMLVQGGVNVRVSACAHCKLPIQTQAWYSWLNHSLVHKPCSVETEQITKVPDEFLQKLSSPANQFTPNPNQGELLAFLVDYVEGYLGGRLQTIKVLRSMVL